MKQSSTPEGAQQLDETLASDDFDGSMLDNLSDMFSGGDTDALSNLGGGLVGNLFGDKASMISDIIGKVTGMKSGTSSSLLAMLVPVVMSYLGKQKRSLGLDSGGMANLLMSQKDEVAKAMPGGMAGALGLTDLGFEDTPMQAPAATPSAQPAVNEAPASSGSGLAKLIPIAVLAIAGFFGYKLMNSGTPAVDNVSSDLTEAIESVDAGSVDLGAMTGGADEMTEKLGEVFTGYQDTIGKVTDVESAKAAVPDMEALNEKLGGMTGLMDKLPAGVKETITGQLGTMIEPIKTMLDTVMAIPGVEPILKPLVDGMLEKVGALTGA